MHVVVGGCDPGRVILGVGGGHLVILGRSDRIVLRADRVEALCAAAAVGRVEMRVRIVDRRIEMGVRRRDGIGIELVQVAHRYVLTTAATAPPTASTIAAATTNAATARIGYHGYCGLGRLQCLRACSAARRAYVTRRLIDHMGHGHALLQVERLSSGATRRRIHVDGGMVLELLLVLVMMMMMMIHVSKFLLDI